MGFEIKNKKIAFFFVLSLVMLSCGNSNFPHSLKSDLMYQISISSSKIIQATFTEDNGAPSIQVFEKNGKFTDQATINPLAPFLITKVENNKVEITYFVASGKDLERFLYAFKNEIFNPKKIGNLSMFFSYKIRDQYLVKPDKYIDDFEFNKKTGNLTLLYKKKEIGSSPISLLVVNNKELVEYDPNTQYHTNYIFTDPSLFNNYFEKIASICK